jgi:hypothetical protein
VLNNPEAPKYVPQSVVGAILPGSIDFLQASPPCIHSSSAKKHGTVSLADKKLEQYLLDATLGHFTRSQPKLFVLENVPPYFTQDRVAQLEQTAAKAGYCFTLTRYRGSDFGLPVARDRIFAVMAQQPLKPCVPWTGDRVRWPDLLIDHLEPEPNGLTKWQQAAVKEDTPFCLIPRVGSWGAAKVTTRCDNLPTITASLGDDSRGGKGRRRMWTVYEPESGICYNVKVAGFAAAMGIPANFLFTSNYRRDIRAIGNGIIPWALNEIVSRSNL